MYNIVIHQKSKIWSVWGYLYKYSQNSYCIPIFSMLQSNFVFRTSYRGSKKIGWLRCGGVHEGHICGPRPTCGVEAQCASAGIEAQCASAGISPSEMAVAYLHKKIIIVIETPLTPYILQVCIVI